MQWKACDKSDPGLVGGTSLEFISTDWRSVKINLLLCTTRRHIGE